MLSDPTPASKETDIRNVFDQEGVEAEESQPPLDDRTRIFLPGIDLEVESASGGIIVKGHFSEAILNALSYLIVQKDNKPQVNTWPRYDH